MPFLVSLVVIGFYPVVAVQRTAHAMPSPQWRQSFPEKDEYRQSPGNRPLNIGVRSAPSLRPQRVPAWPEPPLVISGRSVEAAEGRQDSWRRLFRTPGQTRQSLRHEIQPEQFPWQSGLNSNNTRSLTGTAPQGAGFAGVKIVWPAGVCHERHTQERHQVEN